ncbi:MAG: hypothetical protein ACW99R_00860 [Candidatus Hodarchaeales archaeon]
MIIWKINFVVSAFEGDCKMDIVTILLSLIGLGLVVVLGGFLIIGILALLYLIITGKRWD